MYKNEISHDTIRMIVRLAMYSNKKIAFRFCNDVETTFCYVEGFNRYGFDVKYCGDHTSLGNLGYDFFKLFECEGITDKPYWKLCAA